MAIPCKICSPFVAGLTPGSDAAGSATEEAAARERVDNTRVFVLRGAAAHVPGAPRAAGLPRAVFEKFKLWDNGKVLRCRFLDGDARVQEKVRAIAKEWEAHANLELRFVARGASHIRISFRDKGFSWSTVGTDALSVPDGQATMNFGWLEPGTALAEYRRVVRHEFGHALGMGHEHQNPAALGRIPWDKPRVYAHYARQGWSREDVDENIFDVYSEDSTNHSAFDPKSIMQYAVPDELTRGRFSIPWNTDFSPMDAEYMRRQYPRNAAAGVELAIGGPRASASLAAGAEVDTYRFEVRAAATFIMATEGATDTVMTLHGPNDPGAVLAWDDDRGRGTNARIVRKLHPGAYWLSVRHKKPAASGSYSIGVSRRA